MLVSDLIPSSSGLAHIGVDGQGASRAFDASTITPYGNIHFISGVIHDPLYGQSGVLRFSLSKTRFGFSSNGGSSFNELNVASNPTLQNLYVGDSSINITSTFGDLEITGNDAKLRVSRFENTQHLNFAAMAEHPDTGLAAGDLWNLRENETYRELLGTMYLNSGSGITNLRTGSGILHAKKIANQAVGTVAGGTLITVQFENRRQLNSPAEIDHLYFHPGSGTALERGNFIFMENGLYMCEYNILLERVGNVISGGRARARIKHPGAGSFVDVIGGETFSFLRDSDHKYDTCCARFLVNAFAGSILLIQAGAGDNNDPAVGGALDIIIVGTIGPGPAEPQQGPGRGGSFLTIERIGARRNI